MNDERRAAVQPMQETLGPVSSGLNLWLELKDPRQMGELLQRLRAERPAIDAALNNLRYVHFARFLTTPDSKALQVITSFDGEFDAYVMDFVLAIGDQFEMILDYVKDRPPSRVQDYPAQFLKFIADHNLGYGELGGGDIGLYSAYPQRTVIDIVGPTWKPPAAVEPAEVRVDATDVQANILRGIGALHGWHVGLRFGSADGVRALLAELLVGTNGAPQLGSDASWIKGAGIPGYVLNLGFTHAGLQALGITAEDEEAFALAHPAFVRGPDQWEAAMANGDVGDSQPALWQLGGAYPVDMVVSLYADDPGKLATQQAALRARCDAHGLSIVNQPWPAAAMLDKVNPKRHLVHFGYADGLAQPRLAVAGAVDDPKKADMQPRAGVGEFLLGANYPNVFGGKDSLGGLSPALAENATFAALRIMEQDVAGFENLLKAASTKYEVSRDWLAARMMGRWPDGTPLSQSPDQPVPEDENSLRNAFDYIRSADHPDVDDDSAGLRCPVGAHIRRMNPRSSSVAGRPHSRRLLRRGMPYGPEFKPGDAADGQPRGLIGLFLCADLQRQFEFILRQWAQGDRATTGLVGHQDPILGVHDTLKDGYPMTRQYRFPRTGKEDVVLDMSRLVRTVGSVYLFMPGLAGVRYLARLAGARGLEADRLRPSFGAQLRKLQGSGALAADAQAAAAPDPQIFDPRAKDFRDDPFPTYAWFRANHPVARLPVVNSTWVFSNEHLQQVVGADPAQFRKRSSTDDSSAGILNMDPPPHTQCRADIEVLFRQVLQAVQPGIPATVARVYAQRCQNRGQVQAIDWMAEFARPVAHAVFFDVFGLSVQNAAGIIPQVEGVLAMATPASNEAVRKEISKRLRKLAKSLYTGPSPAPGRLFERILGMQGWYDRQSNPDEFLVSGRLVEQLSNAATMCLAGFLPLQWFTALAVWRLLENDGALLGQLKADAAIGNRDVVDELLRFDTSLPLSDRHVVNDGTVLGGVALNRDDRVTLAWSSANRDTARFGADADVIDLRRRQGPGWAFGAEGERICLGREMVYLVMEPVIEVLRTANPVPRLAAGFQPAWGTPTQGAMFRAMAALKVHS